MCSDKVIQCAKALLDKEYNIAFIESATAGRMCSEFALTEYSGEILRGGLVCYSVFVKDQFLHVPHILIENYTPESSEVTKAMAKGGRKLFNADVTVAVSGLTTSGGSETPEKPVGTMFLHIIIKKLDIAHREVFQGKPSEIILQTTDRGAEIILEHLEMIK